MMVKNVLIQGDDMSRTIDYGNLMHDAMRSLIRNLLLDIADNGLPGEHHFFITFDTSHPDAELADWLSDRYPGEMTVVMQHWYDNLEVTDDGFSVTLSFGDAPEPLYIPYDAIRTFVDPSVEFGLRFEQQDDDKKKAVIEEVELSQPETDDLPLPQTDESELEVEEEPVKAAEIVSLDSFRKT
jgi:hypothetical protein